MNDVNTAVEQFTRNGVIDLEGLEKHFLEQNAKQDETADNTDEQVVDEQVTDDNDETEVDDEVYYDDEVDEQVYDNKIDIAAQEREIQRQVELRLKQELAARKELKIAQQLQELYGADLDTIERQLEQARLEAKAQKTGLTVEQIKAQQMLEQKQAELQQQMYDMQFQQWNAEKELERVQLQKQYPFISDEAIAYAKQFIIQNELVNFTLDDALTTIYKDAYFEQKQQYATKNKEQTRLAQKKGVVPKVEGQAQTSAPKQTENDEMLREWLKFGGTKDDFHKFVKIK